jgi:type IV secretory pathway VirB2 component (pilin)
MRKSTALLITGAALALIAEPSLATTTSGMPWDAPLNNVLDSLQGNIARVVILAAIIITGFTWAFGEHGSGARKFAGILFGGALALGATSMVSALGLTAAVL